MLLFLLCFDINELELKLCAEENKVICINNKMAFFCVSKRGGIKHCAEGIWKLCFHTDILMETNSWLQITEVVEELVF